jgi:hypothetical protein
MRGTIMSKPPEIASVDDYYGVPTGHVPRIKDTQKKEVHFIWTPTDDQLGKNVDRFPTESSSKSWVHNTELLRNNDSVTLAMNEPTISQTKHNHYFKDVSHLKTIDVYRVLELFEVADPCIQHAVKKLLVAGGRGAGKSLDKDVGEAIDSLKRYQEMRSEDYTHV